MTRNAASKCNNKYLSASKSCVRKNNADLTCIHYEVSARDRMESRNILCLGSRWNCVQLC